MAYLDYSLPEVVDYSKGIEKFGDALTEVMRVRQQRDQQDKQLQFQREQEQRRYQQMQEQNAYQNRIIDQREKRDQLEFAQRQAERERAASERARHAASPQEAEAIVHDTAVYDPATGKELGRGKLEAGPMRDIGPAPQAPTVPQAPNLVPDIAQAIPGMPPELAAMMRGKKVARPNPVTLDQLAQEPDQLQSRLASLPDPAERKGKLFVDQINDDGIATLIDDQGEKLHVRAGKGWQEGSLIGPDGRAIAAPQAQGDTRRFEPESQGARFDIAGASDAYDKYAGEQAAFEKANAALPGQQAAYEQERRRAEAERPYTISFPSAGGTSSSPTTFDFKTQRYAASEAAAQQFLDNLPTNMTPDQQQAARETYSAIKSGVDPQKAQAMFAQRLRLGVEQGFKHGEGLLRDEAALERAKIPKPGFNLQVSRLGLDERKEQSKNLRSDLKTFAERYGAKTIQEDTLQIPRIEKDLQSGQPQRQRNAMVQLWQMAQHDHRFSDKDAVMAQTVDPSYLAQIENWLSLKSTGSLDPDVQRTAIDTARSFGAYLSSKTAQMRQMAKQDFVDSGLYDQHEADVLLSQQIPGWARQTQSAPAGGGPPEVNARRRGKAKGTTVTKTRAPDPLDEAMQ